MKERTTLWMRYVNFENVIKILQIVKLHDGRLSASNLEQLIRKERMFPHGLAQKEGGHSTLYHYRKVMEHLNLIILKNKVYSVGESNETKKLLEITSTESHLSEEVKEILRRVILSNLDCKEYYFDLFVNCDTYDIDALKKSGLICEASTLSDDKVINLKVNSEKISDKTKAFSKVKLKSQNGKTVILDTYDKITAIYWGVRIWCNDLGITDELVSSRDSNLRIIYPIRQFDEGEMQYRLLENLHKLPGDDDWLYIYVPTLLENIVRENRWARDDILGFIREFLREHRSTTLIVPTSSSFADYQSTVSRRREVLKKQYLIYGGKYYSHIGLNRELLKEVNHG